MKIFRAVLTAAAGAWLLLQPCAMLAAAVQWPRGDLLQGGDGSFYGTSASGGASSYGTIYRVTPTSEVTVLVEFTGDTGNFRGSFPLAGLVRDAAGNLWGTTEQGGSGYGTIYRYNPATKVFSSVVSFTGTAGVAPGAHPAAALIADGAGNLWGTTRRGGTQDLGTVFRVATATGALSPVVDFTGITGAARGSHPQAALYRDAAGTIWGTCAAGGTADLGTLFRIEAVTNAFSVPVEFTGTNGVAPGSLPQAGLVAGLSGELWGVTTKGGTANAGTVFRLDPTTGVFSSRASFTGSNGAYPSAALTHDGLGNFWGTTLSGGSSDLGTVFRFEGASNVITPLVQLTGTTGVARGAYPLGGLALDGLGSLWGSASQGGREDRGTLFRVATATGAYSLLAEPNFKPTPPVATIRPPASAVLTGPVGNVITLTGTASDNLELLEVLVSLNGGPFLPATIIPSAIPGRPSTWELSVTPENGINVAIVKSVDSGGDTSRPRTLLFNYTVSRPAMAGSYHALGTPDATSLTTGDHTGLVSLTASNTGRFTGRLAMGGLALPASFSGSLGNDGTARFGRTGTPGLLIVRRNRPPLYLTLAINPTAPFAGEIVGAVSENGTVVTTFSGARAEYTSRRNPLPPLVNVPATLLDPLTDRGLYTAAILAEDPGVLGLSPDAFPQGDGYASVRVNSAGTVIMTGRLADGTAFSAANAILRDNASRFFVKLYGNRGSISGRLAFRDVSSQSDADAPDIQWFRPANGRATNYRAGWPGGIQADMVCSKFVLPRVSGLSYLGNAPSPGVANATLSLTEGGLGAALRNELSFGLTPGAVVIGTTPGATGAAGVAVSVGGTGILAGRFVNPGNQRHTLWNGVVFQKSASGYGYFLAKPAGAVAADPVQSGRVEILGR